MAPRSARARIPPHGTAPGFSLLEVMVAAGILGLAVSAMTILIGNSDSMLSLNDHSRQARIIAQEELEDPKNHFLNYDLAGADLSSIQLDYQEPPRPSIPADRNIQALEQTETIAGVAVTYKVVSSTVTWQERGQTQAHSVSLKKRVARVR